MSSFSLFLVQMSLKPSACSEENNSHLKYSVLKVKHESTVSVSNPLLPLWFGDTLWELLQNRVGQKLQTTETGSHVTQTGL